MRQRRVAADVPLREPVQQLQRHLAQHEAQVQVGLRDRLHVAPAHLAAITFVALRHYWWPQALGSDEPEA